ncbi:hypothetical protein DFH07DRAFT_14274 [Mycena maculata]|uniref:Uncharacterized protein n=1 Tax=Mycena maculata TaxID=230809 RepID=A0AAD7N4B5_9AGAR|nr:hypothetical protein DFH07DRAFT_14274 [Mycena maculata]
MIPDGGHKGKGPQSWRMVGLDSCDAADRQISLGIWSPWGYRYWLTQANHIFNCLKITSSYEDYVLITQINYHLNIVGSKESTPTGYLFLCSLADLELDVPGQFRLPECPSYWSLDPSGVEHLTMEGAKALGFPIIQVEMRAEGYSWDGSVYVGLHQFHEGKGFNPNSQDVARHLGYPLVWLPREPGPPSACVDIEGSGHDVSGSYCPVTADDELHNKLEDKGASSIEEKDCPLINLICKEDEIVNTEEQENGLAVSIQDSRSPVYELTIEEPRGFDDEAPPFSPHWQLFMWVKLALIVFLAGSWIYEHMYIPQAQCPGVPSRLQSM